MPERKAFLLRIDPAVLEAMTRWAADDLRSLNGQIEFLLRRALAESGRVRAEKHEGKRRAAMVSNLMVVLCGERDTQPVVNAGSLYQ